MSEVQTPNQALHSDRVRILVSRSMQSLQRLRRVNCCVRYAELSVSAFVRSAGRGFARDLETTPHSARQGAFLKFLEDHHGKEPKEAVMISGYRCSLYDARLEKWHRHEFELPNNAASGVLKRRMVEAVWCNFRSRARKEAA